MAAVLIKTVGELRALLGRFPDAMPVVIDAYQERKPHCFDEIIGPVNMILQESRGAEECLCLGTFNTRDAAPVQRPNLRLVQGNKWPCTCQTYAGAICPQHPPHPRGP